MITKSHPLVGKLVGCNMFPIGCFTGLVRKVNVVRGEGVRELVVQRPGRADASTLSATCCGDKLRVPISKVTGVINRRRAAGSQIEPITPFLSMSTEVTVNPEPQPQPKQQKKTPVKKAPKARLP